MSYIEAGSDSWQLARSWASGNSSGESLWPKGRAAQPRTGLGTDEQLRTTAHSPIACTYLQKPSCIW